MLEPLTSILLREVTILAKKFGDSSRCCWEIRRALLQHRGECDKMAINKGESGAESDGAASLPGSASDEPSWLQEDMKWAKSD